MNYLVISDNDSFSDSISSKIKQLEKSAKIITIFFKKSEVKKFTKKIEELTLCIIYSENESSFSEQSKLRIANACGYAIAKDILVITNLKFLEDISLFSSENFRYFSTDNQIFDFIKQQYDHINITNEKRIAKKRLLEKGIPFTSDCFATYIAKNKTEICDLFISAGIDINSRDESGTSMLNVAVRNDNEDFVKQFLSLGADINSVSEDRGYTPVMDAVWRGNLEITKLLVKKGAELNTINKEGQTNLVLAVGADKNDICKVLVEHGADPDIKDQMGMSAYGYATLFRKEKLIEILKPYHKEN